MHSRWMFICIILSINYLKKASKIKTKIYICPNNVRYTQIYIILHFGYRIYLFDYTFIHIRTRTSRVVLSHLQKGSISLETGCMRPRIREKTRVCFPAESTHYNTEWKCFPQAQLLDLRWEKMERMRAAGQATEADSKVCQWAPDPWMSAGDTNGCFLPVLHPQ